MNKRTNIFFLCSLIFGCLIYGLQQLDVWLPSWINHYLNDFLIIPIVLGICLFILKKSKGQNYEFSLWLIIYLCAGYSIYFEMVLPTFHHRYTADPMDVFLYFAGGLIFYFLQKRPNKTIRS